MAALGSHFAIGDTLLLAAQTKDTTGTPTDADSLPTYQIYEQGGTTAITSGSFAKRDDAGTTGYYEASVSLTTAGGFEFGKQYVVRKLATVSTQEGIALDYFKITGAGATTVSALTDWPAVADITAKLAAAGITLRDDADSDYIQLIINAVVAEILQETKREFVAGSAETRYYNGSGTGLQLVDPMVSLTSVTLASGNPVVAGAELTYVELVNRSNYPRNTLHIYQGGASFIRFPEGRDNIAVTGVFGYGEAIPQDVWEAAAMEVAERLALETMFSQGGRLAEWAEADVKEKYAVLVGQTGVDWHGKFLATLRRYKRPFSESATRIRPPMV